MKGYIVDVESKRMSDATGIVYSISLMFVEYMVNKKWTSHGRGIDPIYESSIHSRHEALQTIFITEAIEDPCLSEDAEIVRKLGQTIVDTVRAGGTMKCMTFADAMRYILGVMHESTWFGHSIDRDIQFLVDTDARYKTRLFRKDPLAYPDTCCILPEWSLIAKVCTQQVITRRCPKFMEKYLHAGGASARLVDLVSFVTGRQQHHTSAQDVLDTASVLQRAFEDDRFQLEVGKSYMTCIPLRTSSLSCQKNL